jgi:hypothetical protein
MKRTKLLTAHGIGRSAAIGQSLYLRIPQEVVRRFGLRASEAFAVGTDGVQIYAVRMEWAKVIKRVIRNVKGIKADAARAVKRPVFSGSDASEGGKNAKAS